MKLSRTSVPQADFAARVQRRATLVRIGGGAVTLAGLAGFDRAEAAAQGTPSAGASEDVARQAIAAVNEALATGDAAVLDCIFAPDVVGHPPHRSLVTGEPFSHDVTGLKAGLADIRRFFPDAAIAIDDMIAGEDRIAARVTFRGTPDFTSIGLDTGAGQPLEIGGLMYGRVAEGRIAEFWSYFDLSPYLDLLGELRRAAAATPDAACHDAMATPQAGVQSAGDEVTVTLTEFTVALNPTALQIGRRYAFVVTNAGTLPHEFVLERQGAVHQPLVAGDKMAMTEEIAPGELITLDWTFEEPGAYQVACHEPNHFESGQFAVFEVTE